MLHVILFWKPDVSYAVNLSVLTFGSACLSSTVLCRKYRGSEKDASFWKETKKKKKTTDASSERYYFSLILPAFIAEVIIHAI